MSIEELLEVRRVLEIVAAHPFYLESDAYRKDIATKQRYKGALKYPELFTPESHTDDELCDHAMMEFHDGQEYVAGLRKRLRELRLIIGEKDAYILELEAQNKLLKGNVS